MPKIAKELTPIEVKRLSHRVDPKSGKAIEVRYPVGGVSGLLLKVTPSGSKLWILRTKIGIKRRDVGLGPYPEISLAQAREKAREVKEKIREGVDPLEEKRALKRALLAEQISTLTFVAAMDEYIKMKEKEFKNPRQAQQWKNSLNTYAVPHIGKVPVREIELSHIKLVLDPIWETKTETANRVRARIENILGWCAIHGYRSNDNPARWQGYLDEVYPSPEKIKKKNHHSALPVEQMPEFMTDLQKRTGTAARALEFLILTAARTNEVIGDKRIGKPGVTWQEVDLKRKLWTVPADRMKSGKEHRVPLTDAAVKLLESMELGKPEALIFPGPKGDIPSNNFLSALLKRMDQKVTAHGFRSTFKDWAREHTAYADEVSELALAHVNSDATRAAYARSELIDKRRLLMADWAQFCLHGETKKESGKVVAIGESKA
ncbi:tyrosine-type recombinase/integrase [Marinobacter qingdaonensis]|uniref:Integrase arm-type DNA-binding domain-containing protein n=1 Tax=Marinobacter qingdaonensis TaxID=3108486 RepID=A0ABU5P1Q5_9GAMM|nr:integrase arm-type DNA-binding domain-containing protein [Marinobacter sp. ASW11-75]MEA1081980.1 integrase arm-type DNA-binding domain-containing protein [Marinobacter sp. ASW11-75]